MIRADEAPDLPPDFHAGGVVSVEDVLDAEEKAVAYMIDAECDDAATQRRPGEMFEILISREVSENVVASIKRLWESGGWMVGVFAIPDELGRPLHKLEGALDEKVYRLVFARPPRPRELVAENATKALETRNFEPLHSAQEFQVPDEATLERISSGTSHVNSRLLVRMPTRARPRQVLEVLERYRHMAVEHVVIEVIIDEDDEQSNRSQFLQHLGDLDCRVTIGKHKSKIQACNAGRVTGWDVLLLASDDMIPKTQGYDLKILADMERHFPLGGGLLCYDDGYNYDHVRPGELVTCTLPVMGAELHARLGYVYYPEYKSIYCDSDLSYVAHKLNRIAFLRETVIEHHHFANDKAPYDALYKFNSRHDDHDRTLFDNRRTAGFSEIEAPILSILICTMPSRRAMLERLVDHLRAQPQAPGQVEIRIDPDPMSTVGEKRQRLLERAVGDYVAFIDDDDWVANDYVPRVLNACCEEKDCCSLIGVLTEDGRNPQRFEHSIAHHEWYTRDDGVHIRTPNHLSAVRRDLALQVGFVSKNVGEDHEYSRRLRPLLKTEASTGDVPVYYYWSVPHRSVQRGAL